MTTVFHKNKPDIKWKGNTLSQLSSSIKLNSRTTSSNNNFFRAQPMKNYRREISSQTPSCNYRISIKIDQINTPGGLSTTNSSKGLAITEDIHLSQNKSFYPNNSITCNYLNPDDPDPNTTSTSVNTLDPAKNALRRLRSSGMTQKKYDIHSTKNYYHDTRQYLNNRNKSFQSNEYFSVRKGDTSVKPGSYLASDNIYSSNTNYSCEKFNLSQDTTFNYKWFDSVTYNVTLPKGMYDLGDLNNVLHNAMANNNHFITKLPYKSKEFFLKFLYNKNNNTLSIESVKYDTNIHNASQYDLISLNIPNTISQFYPTIEILNNEFLSISGFPVGNYPTDITPTSDYAKVTQGSLPSKIQELYYQIHYKPKNYQFATNAAVSSSSLIARKKYDNITNVGSSFRTAFGKQSMNAIAYGSSEYGYTIKDKIGYPMIETPVFKDGQLCKVRKFKYRLA